MRPNRKQHSIWQRFVSIFTIFASCTVTALALTACGGSDSTPAFFATTPTTTVAAPGAPTNVTATAAENLVDLQWSPPAVAATVGLPTSYEIYVSTTATTTDTVFVAANHLASVPVVDGKTVYAFTNSGLAGTTDYYYVITAKNAGGETAAPVVTDRPTGSPNPVVAGNNFSGALIFADDIGITNAAITGVWTKDPTAIDYNSGLRPLVGEVISILPYLVEPSKVDPLYFEQKSVNTWQGEWAKGKAAPVNVTAKWGDNLTGTASLSSTAKIRLEMVLTTTVTTPMTTYTMKSLYGARINEMFGTNGVELTTTTPFVMASNAHLTIHKLDAGGNKILPAVQDQSLFDTAFKDGLNKLSAEIPVSGNFTYGFVWDPTTTSSTAGTYRVTFLLDPKSLFGVGTPDNNTFMKTATNGVRVSDSEVYIDITVK